MWGRISGFGARIIRLIRPKTHFATDDIGRKQYLTEWVLILMVTALSLFTLLVAAGWIIGVFAWIDVAIMLALDAPSILCWALARRGRWQWGSYLAPVLMFGLGAFGSSIGWHTSFVVFYGLAILLTGILIGNRAQWVMVGLCIITHIGLAGAYEPRPLDDQLAVAITLSGGFVGIALLQWFSTRQLQLALVRARATTADLRVEVAERQQAEATLRESEQRLRLIFESAFDGISVHRESHDGTRILEDCNEQYARMAGRTKEELLSVGDTRHFQRPLDTDQEAYVWAVWNRQPHHGIFSWNRPDGRDNIVEYAAVSVPFGDELLIIGIDRDITERIQATREREALVADLEIKNTELERFTYTVSHDLKSPLITISGFAGFLEQDAMAGNVEQVRQDIIYIDDAITKMQRLLSELLELSRIGRLMNPPEEVAFEAIAREAIALVQGRITARGVEVVIAPGLPTVHGDRARLVEVVQNLIDNACKFMGDHPHPQIDIGARQDGGEAVFYVRDNGIGIDPRYHDQVFGLFNKLDSTGEGTGIGLALVKRIVETHGGRIWIESEVGTGSTFCFTLAGIR
ncbi:MAG: PAS domain S-box protein [Anaerolineae bacterium]|nr:PAS domain S-box protein [Anaerolineae bacterium]